jgi:hypothetical protein
MTATRRDQGDRRFRLRLLPPSDIDNAVTRLWDIHMRPDWREVAKAREARLGEPPDMGTDRETFDGLKETLGSSAQIAEEQVDPSGPDYFITSRRIRAKKGKRGCSRRRSRKLTRSDRSRPVEQ